MSNAMRFGKRSLAGVAAGALALGMISFAGVSSATAAPSVKPKSTATTAAVDGVRVTYTGTTTITRENVPFSPIYWTTAAALSGNETVDVSVTVQPVGGAVWISNNTDLDAGTTATNTNAAVFGTPKTNFNPGFAATPIGGTAVMGINAAFQGTYSGTITVYEAGVPINTVSYSFTTAGVPKSLAITPATQSTAVSGGAPLAVSLLDAAGNLTQPLSAGSDQINITGTGTPTTLTPTTLNNTNMQGGYIDLTYVAPSTAGTYTVTATPVGTLPASGVTAQSATISVAGSIAKTALSTISVTTPSDAVNAGTQPSARTAQVPAGTTAVVATITGAASTTYRLGAYGSTAGLINGVSPGTSISATNAFVDVTTNASGVGTATFNLGGNLTLATNGITVYQVQANNTTRVTGVQLDVTQALPAVGATTIVPSPRGAIVQALGNSTPVTVTVLDQFGDPVPNATVQAYRGTTMLLSSGVTNASGQASVTVSALTGTTAGGSETYNFYAIPFAGTRSDASAYPLTITYTASGAVTSMSVTVGTAGSTTPVLNTTTSIAVLPYIQPPFGGYVDTANTSVYTVATGGAGQTPAGNYVTFTAAPNPANMVTVTVPEGVKVSTTLPAGTNTLWSAGTQTVTAASSQPVYVWATKTGTHDIKFTSGAITTTAKIQVATPSAAAYNITASPATRTIEAGAFSTVELKVTDVFGNPVPATTVATPPSGGVSATASGEVLLSGLTATSNIATGATGTATVTLIAGKAGTGKVEFAPMSASTNLALAWRAGYVPPTGAPAPVTSAAVAIVVQEAAAKSLVIAGERATVSGKPGIKVDGLADGFEDNAKVKPWVRFPGETAYAAGSARPVVTDEEFTWQRKTGKKVYVYFTSEDDAIKSNRIIIQAN